MIVAVAVGVGALTGVRAFSSAFRHMLLRQARTLMAGDLSVRVFATPSPEQDDALRQLESRGVRHTWITETVTMAASDSTPDPLLISVKAVNPNAYPYYGEVKLDPPQALRQALTAQSVVVSSDLLFRLNVKVGDQLHIGGQDFRIAGVVTGEPDRMTGSLNVGPRVMISREGLERTGLLGIGSRAAERFLLKLPATGETVGQARADLKIAFPDGLIADYTETHPIITRGLDRSTTFLSLIALIAMAIGAMGVGSAMRGHLQLKMDSIAMMKCIGARSGQVIRIYTAQTLMLGLGGGALGALFGIAVAAAFPSFISHYFSMDIASSFDPLPALEGLATACLVTLLFTLPPLLAIRDVRPAQVFRRNVEGRRSSWRTTLPAAGLILVGIGGVAASLTEGSWKDALRTGLVFALGLALGTGLLAATGWLLLRGVRIWLRLGPSMPAAVRHGIANLYRPGNQAQAAVAALGIGVMFTLTVFLVERALMRQIHASAPPGAPNVFLLDVPRAQLAEISAFIQSQPGVAAMPEIASAVAARITSVNGTPVENLGLKEYGQRFLRPRMVTEVASEPAGLQLVSGEWWRAGVQNQVCVAEEVAQALHLTPGSEIDWDIWKHPVKTQVVCVERTESIRMAGRFEFLFQPGPLAGLPSVSYGSARVRPADVAALQRSMYQRYPTVTVVNMADVLQIVEDVVDKIAVVVRFISIFTILAGAITVASTVAGAHLRRLREVVILKTLGATRRRIAWIFSVEFLALGAVSGLVGTLLGVAFSAVILQRLLDIPFRIDAAASAASVVIAAAVAVCAGWAASFRVLGRRPLEILREE